MHVLVVSVGFPSLANPWRFPFVREQVLQVCKRVERVTVLSPTAFVPFFARKFRRGAVLASIPEGHSLIEGKCEVLFPRYLKAPGFWFLNWTKAQWCHIVEKTVTDFKKSHPISVIHAHMGGVAAWASLVASRRHGIPLVVTYHGSEVHDRLVNRKKGWKMCRDVFKYAHLNLPVSRDLERILRKHVKPQGRCETLLLGADQSKFFTSSDRKQEKSVLFIGNIIKEKGIRELLLAWKQVKQVCSDAVLTVVGNDCTGGEFLNQAFSLNIADSVRMVGPLPHEKIPEVMRQVSLFCLPSHGEGTPVSIMEAMSCGLPVVATRVGGIPDIITHNQTGLLVDKGDVQGLADAIISLLMKPEKCDRLSQAAEIYAREHFDGERSSDRLAKHYMELSGMALKKDRVLD